MRRRRKSSEKGDGVVTYSKPTEPMTSLKYPPKLFRRFCEGIFEGGTSFFLPVGVCVYVEVGKRR